MTLEVRDCYREQRRQGEVVLWNDYQPALNSASKNFLVRLCDAICIKLEVMQIITYKNILKRIRGINKFLARTRLSFKVAAFTAIFHVLLHVSFKDLLGPL